MNAGLLAIGLTIVLYFLWRTSRQKGKLVGIKSIRRNSKIAVLGRLSRGKLLRKLAAQARRDYPGQSEEWYWKRANEQLKRYRG
ncbi:hypothetical protein [Leptolyngbya ohadii]|uniref:hypothetical protein n=1 Tax=Leptolyngbya ohadii TaxID=1962290 RepID=UPI000B59F688|nr:hypothetical protein [Leptolyngbya ohadii]